MPAALTAVEAPRRRATSSAVGGAMQRGGAYPVYWLDSILKRVQPVLEVAEHVVALGAARAGAGGSRRPVWLLGAAPVSSRRRWHRLPRRGVSIGIGLLGRPTTARPRRRQPPRQSQDSTVGGGGRRLGRRRGSPRRSTAESIAAARPSTLWRLDRRCVLGLGGRRDGPRASPTSSAPCRAGRRRRFDRRSVESRSASTSLLRQVAAARVSPSRREPSIVSRPGPPPVSATDRLPAASCGRATRPPARRTGRRRRPACPEVRTPPASRRARRLDQRRRGRRAERRDQRVEIERRGRPAGVGRRPLGRTVGRRQRHPIGSRQQFLMRLLEGQPVGRPRFGARLPRQLLDDLLELRVVPGQRQRALEVLERRCRVAFAVEDLRQAADGGQVLGRLAGHELQFEARLVELPEIEQGPPQRHPRRQVAGMPGQPFAADPHRLLGLPGAAVLLRQLRKGNRRRVGFDPASQIVDTGMGHRSDLRASLP